MGDSDESLRRRAVLRASVAAAVASLAGCNTGGGADATPTSTASETAAGTATETTTEHQSTDAGRADGPPVEKLSEAVVPLETTDPTVPLGRPEAVRSMVADAAVIGLGDATHGTRELYRLKHRLLRYMVEEIELRTIALEANFSETLLIDEYVRGGDVDVAAALDNVYFWVWDTQSVRSLLEWLRSFNQGRKPTDQVRFFGYDVQFARGPARRLQSFFERADPDFLETVRSDLEIIATEGLYADSAETRRQRMETARSLVGAVDSRLSEKRGAYVDATSEAAVGLADRHRWTMARASDLLEAQLDEQFLRKQQRRDRAMAENVQWIREFTGVETVAAWGHNGHVRDGIYPPKSGNDAMGAHLAETYGEDYYVLASVVGSGTVRAIAPHEDDELTAVEVEDPPEGTLSAAFREVEHSTFALDFDAVEDEELRSWLDREHSVLEIGAAYDPNWPESQRYLSLNVTDAYDGLLYTDTTTATTPVGGEQ